MGLESAGGESDVLSQLEQAVSDLARLISGALRRVVEAEPMAIAVVADVPPTSTLVERTVRSGVPPTPSLISVCARFVIPEFLCTNAKSQESGRISQPLPVKLTGMKRLI